MFFYIYLDVLWRCNIKKQIIAIKEVAYIGINNFVYFMKTYIGRTNKLVCLGGIVATMANLWGAYLPLWPVWGAYLPLWHGHGRPSDTVVTSPCAERPERGGWRGCTQTLFVRREGPAHRNNCCLGAAINLVHPVHHVAGGPMLGARDTTAFMRRKHKIKVAPASCATVSTRG